MKKRAIANIQIILGIILFFFAFYYYVTSTSIEIQIISLEGEVDKDMENDVKNTNTILNAIYKSTLGNTVIMIILSIMMILQGLYQKSIS